MKELEEALRTIKAECEKHNYCSGCPLRTHKGHKCTLIRVSPQHWEFASEPEKVPRVFR